MLPFRNDVEYQLANLPSPKDPGVANREDLFELYAES